MDCLETVEVPIFLARVTSRGIHSSIRGARASVRESAVAVNVLLPSDGHVAQDADAGPVAVDNNIVAAGDVDALHGLALPAADVDGCLCSGNLRWVEEVGVGNRSGSWSLSNYVRCT